MIHPKLKLLADLPKGYAYYGDWCHAGGVANWFSLGHITDHENYGYSHVTGAVYWEDGSETKSNNCIFCGKVFKLNGQANSQSGEHA